MKSQKLKLLIVLIPLILLFLYVAFRSGPLAPVPVTLIEVENKALSPSLHGIGTVEARYNYKIGSTVAGRVSKLDVHVGDFVKAGQVLGKIDPIDLDALLTAQLAALSSAKAQLREAKSRYDYTKIQFERYKNLLKLNSTSEETVATKKQELQISEAALQVAKENIKRLEAEKNATIAKKNNLILVSPVNGLVVKRNVTIGTTVVAGQSMIEIIDPDNVWINVRFDQIKSEGLSSNLPAHIKLKSSTNTIREGYVLRVEPIADSITEEILAKIVFKQIPTPLPPIGELAEVTVDLPKLEPTPTILNAAIRKRNGKIGVWKYENDKIIFTPIVRGKTDLNGITQVIKGLKQGDRIILYSEKPLNKHTKIRIVKKLAGVTK